ncbi:hypothetical protein [Vogesella alkaliphila]|uniref:Phage integrase family protein n=1 Tax=Vogesella alkaliphila TaxID=1193621 RepID=A0ABQ2YC65_9NEIS|nr:hypothetical protein [Vogesella alkaliphila]GGX78869.1 hypothetical protein GCM10011290_02830 [Vogesella alkaliphila]
MAKTDSRFEDDSLGALCQLVVIEPDALRPLLDWINAPPNLQQLRSVIDNLVELFEVGQHSPLLPEFALDEAQIASWKSILEILQASLPTKLSSELQHLNARKKVRPDGLIGDYPEYASLVASEPGYPENEITVIRYLHFIALGAAAGYRQQIASGEVKQPTGCIDTGMRKIRDLATPNKRPVFPIPDLRAETTLKACQAALEALTNANADKASQEWGDQIRGLFRAYSEKRESQRKRYELELDKIGEIRKIPAQEDPDWASETGTTDQSANPVRVITTFISRPDEASCRELMRLGLSPEECTTQSAVALNDPGAPRLAQNEARLSRLRSRGLLHGIIQAAQALPDSWGTPTAYEIERLVRQLSNEPQPDLKTVPQDEMPALRAILLLRLWTGRALDDLLSLRIVSNPEDYAFRDQNSLIFIEDTATLLIPISSPSRKRGINPIDQALIQSPELSGRPTSTESSILVSLPKAATSILQNYFHNWKLTKKRKTHRRPFEHCTTDFAAGIKAYLAHINGQHATRWTDARLSHIMRQAIFQSTGDQVFVYLLTKQETGHAVVAAHYQCTDVAYLAAIFQRAHAWIISTVRDGTAPHLPSIESLPHPLAPAVGSSLAVSDTFVRELCSHLKLIIRSQQRQSPSLTTWIGIHNALAAYIAHWLGFCSGYRAVRDPLHDPRELDQQTGLLVISDKDDDHYRHSRVVCLPLNFVEQMHAYVEHLLSLATKLTSKPSLQSEIRGLCQRYRNADTRWDGTDQAMPFLFFLSPQLRVRNVSPSTLAEFNPTELPGNIDRHYLRSKLSALGAPGEHIDYFMGHWERGEEPYQQYSMVSPLQIGLTLQPYLEKISKACGWSVQIGLRGC